MRKAGLEITVGIFMIVGILCLGYLSVKLARMEVVGTGGVNLIAVFSNTGGLKTGANIEIAGVPVGRVRGITLEDYRARVELFIREDVEIQDDAIARIKTKGLLGEKYVDIIPGGSDMVLSDNERIFDTESPIDIEDLISKFVFGDV